MAVMPQFARLLPILLLVPVLGGCVREADTPPPAGFPGLDAARMAGRPDCPALAGRYSGVADAGSNPALAQALLAEPGADALQVVHAGTSLQFASWWPPAAVASAATSASASAAGRAGGRVTSASFEWNGGLKGLAAAGASTPCICR